MKYTAPFEPENAYHIFNRANGHELLFTEPGDYHFFLAGFLKYILPVAEIYAYTLIPNHFHFLIRVKPLKDLEQNYILLNRKVPEGNEWMDRFVMQQFSNFENSYAKSFNNNHGRKGALFMDCIRRCAIESDEQFTATLFYIHKNPVHHGLAKNIGDWMYCSYIAFLTIGNTHLQRAKVIEWFGSLEKFIAYHQQEIHLKHAKELE